jgi:hypothetical protein
MRFGGNSDALHQKSPEYVREASRMAAFGPQPITCAPVIGRIMVQHGLSKYLFRYLLPPNDSRSMSKVLKPAKGLPLSRGSESKRTAAIP